MRKSIIISAVLLLAPAVSQAKTLEELLVEKGVITRAEATGSHSAPAKVSWKNGTRIEFPSEGVTTNIAAQLQERYTFTDGDGDAGEENTSSFSTRRARIIVSGTALHEEFNYVLQTDFVGKNDDGDGERAPELRDAFINWNACDWAAVRMGQFKAAVSRQFNASSSKLQFVDRSIASEQFDLDRNQGAEASATLMDGMAKVGAAIFNGQSDGEGVNRPGNDTNQLGVVSFRVNALGQMDAYEEGDIKQTEDLAVNVGGAWGHGESNNEVDLIGGADTAEFDKDVFSFDANIKSQGLSVHGEYFYQNLDSSDILQGEDSTDEHGFYVQVGYFLDSDLEVAGRYSLVNCDNDGVIQSGVCSDGGLDKVNEWAATVNYYFWKHNLKAQLGYTHLNEDFDGESNDDVDTNKYIFQISAYM